MVGVVGYEPTIFGLSSRCSRPAELHTLILGLTPPFPGTVGPTKSPRIFHFVVAAVRTVDLFIRLKHVLSNSVVLTTIGGTLHDFAFFHTSSPLVG